MSNDNKLNSQKEDLISCGMHIIRPRLPRKERAFKECRFGVSTVCVLRLAGYTIVDIQRITGLSRTTVKKYIREGRDMYPRIEKDL